MLPCQTLVVCCGCTLFKAMFAVRLWSGLARSVDLVGALYRLCLFPLNQEMKQGSKQDPFGWENGQLVSRKRISSRGVALVRR